MEKKLNEKLRGKILFALKKGKAPRNLFAELIDCQEGHKLNFSTLSEKAKKEIEAISSAEIALSKEIKTVFLNILRTQIIDPKEIQRTAPGADYSAMTDETLEEIAKLIYD